MTIDTLRADHVGCYGAGPGRTLTLDELAAAGARFETAISPAPLTLPAHASLLSALDPPQHGVRSNGSFRLREDVPLLAERLRGAGFATAAFVSAFVLERRFGLARGFDHFDDRTSALPAGGASAVAERPAAETVDAALTWLERAPDRFFLWVHLYDPHAPYAPPAVYAARHPGQPYRGEIASADAELGRLLAALRREGTLVVATSDHGESLGEHGEPTHAYSVYEATQRVPLIVRGPGVPVGATVRELVRLVDVAPTVLDLAQLQPLEGVRGQSLVPLLRGGEEAPRVAYVETLATRLDFGWSALLGVRTGGWKWVRAPRPELYDLAADPGETRNLAEREPARAAELDRMLADLLAGARPIEAARTLSSEDRARLASLGYLAGRGSASAASPDAVGGIDPKDAIAAVAAVHEASALVARGRGGEALARLAPLGEVGPEIELIRAAAALAAGDFAAARASAARVQAGDPEGTGDLQIRGRLGELEGDLDGAEAIYRRALARSPGSGWALAALGRIAETRGDREVARSHYRDALEARQADGEASWRLAALVLEDGQREEAERQLAGLPLEALRAPAAAERLALAEWRAGRPDLALARVQGALQGAPEALPLLRLAGALLEEEGRLDDALAARERILAAAPADGAALNDVAWSLAHLERDLPRALSLAREALTLAPGSPRVLDTLATVHLRLGEPAEALAVADRGLANAGSEARVTLLLVRAEALALLGREDEAERTLSEALRGGEGLPPSVAREAQRVEERIRAAGG